MIKVYIPILFFAVVYVATGPDLWTYRILFYFLLFPCCLPRGVVSKAVLAENVLSTVEHTVIVLDDS